MTQLKICHPKGNIPTTNGVVIASGRASEDVVGVRGNWGPRPGPGGPEKAKTLGFYMERKKVAAKLDYRWSIAFKVKNPGWYSLEVVAYGEAGPLTSKHVEFEVSFFFGARITWPSGPGNIDDQADDFVAYGTLDNSPLGNVTMTDSQNNVIYPIFTNSDCTDLHVWSAGFPSLPHETYSLYAEDTDHNGEQIDGLVVTIN